MRKILLLSVSILTMLHLEAQTLATFETLSLPVSNYWKGVAAVPTVSDFSDGGFYFTNAYDTAWGTSWSGWGYSALSDSVSTSYTTNELAAFPAKGANGSSVYAVAYESYNPAFNSIRLSNQGILYSVRLSNTTIAYRSMKNGDGFAKKFGGVTGNDSDYFRINFQGWNNGTATGNVDFYLADFRDPNNANDYILKDWGTLNLLSLGMVDSVTFKLSSSDTNSFGFKTPAYFCLDNLQAWPESVMNLSLNDQIHVYPNPFHESLAISNKGDHLVEFEIMDIQGRTSLRNQIIAHSSKTISTSHLGSGFYIIRLKDAGQVYTQKLLKTLE